MDKLLDFDVMDNVIFVLMSWMDYFVDVLGKWFSRVCLMSWNVFSLMSWISYFHDFLVSWMISCLMSWIFF